MQLEKCELYQKILEHVSQGSEEEVDQKVQNYLAYILELSLLGWEQLENLKVRSGRTLKRGGEEEARRANRRNGARQERAFRRRATVKGDVNADYRRAGHDGWPCRY